MATSIVSYRKTSDAYTTYQLRMPDAQGVGCVGVGGFSVADNRGSHDGPLLD